MSGGQAWEASGSSSVEVGVAACALAWSPPRVGVQCARTRARDACLHRVPQPHPHPPRIQGPNPPLPYRPSALLQGFPLV